MGDNTSSQSSDAISDPRKRVLAGMPDQELAKTLRKAEELRDMLVKQENDLMFEERRSGILATGERERIAREYLTAIDLIENIKKEQMKRQVSAGQK